MLGSDALARVASEVPDRLQPDVVGAAGLARLAETAVADRGLERVRIGEGDETVPHGARRDPHIAVPRVESRSLALKRQMFFRVVLELRPGEDVAEQQADDVGIVGKFERIGLGARQTVVDTAIAAARGKLLQTIVAELPRPPNSHRHLRLPPPGTGADPFVRSAND